MALVSDHSYFSSLINCYHNKKTCQGCGFALLCSKSLTGVFYYDCLGRQADK